jgi:hypothetical protein
MIRFHGISFAATSFLDGLARVFDLFAVRAPKINLTLSSETDAEELRGDWQRVFGDLDRAAEMQKAGTNPASTRSPSGGPPPCRHGLKP